MSGLIKSLPWLQPEEISDTLQLEDEVTSVLNFLIKLDHQIETTPYFLSGLCRMSIGQISASIVEGNKLAQQKIEQLDHKWNIYINGLYGVNDLIVDNLREQVSFEILGQDGEDEDLYDDFSTRQLGHFINSYIIGTVFGRWDIRYTTGEKLAMELPDPFAPLPACPPGMLQNTHGLPVAPQDVPTDYPMRISWGGILADDEGHPEDIEVRTREALHVIWQERAEAIEAEACQILGVRSLREYFRKPGLFFAEHLKRYSKSRRAAPIYWPLSTPSCSYTLWLYYHRLSDQTLFTCVNDFVDPKLQQVSAEAARLRQKARRSAADDKELERLNDLEHELKDFRAELLRVAAFWKPNLNDGVEITASPLWRLFQHKPWQKRLKETWGRLEAGEYDWAHLAYSIWPDRVREKCRNDKSLAIAHDLEALYIEPSPGAKKKAGRKKEEPEMESFFDDEN